MIFPYLLAAVSIIYTLQSNITSNIKDGIIPDDIHSWCPYTQFCNAEQVNQETSVFNNKQQPCCEPCSCHPSCGLRRNCCTDKHDLHRIDETLGTICKPLNKDDINRYYVVDKCPGKKSTCRLLNTDTRDGFAPVYSKISGMIYYNSHCAFCHNESELVEFQPSLLCPALYDGAFSNKIFDAINGDDEQCFLHFLIPEDINISSERCHRFLTQDCSDQSPQHLKDLCRRFNATYFHHDSYFKNVYCYLCMKHDLPTPEDWGEANVMCPIYESNRAIRKSTLLVLLDKGTIENYQAPTVNQENNRVMCFENKDRNELNRCQPVLCPFGQLRVRGICSFMGQTWYVSILQLVIRLSPIKPGTLMAEDLFKLETSQLDRQIQGILRQLRPQNWTMEMYFNANQNESNIRYFIAVLILRNEWIKPVYFFNKLDENLHSKWTIFGLDFNPSFNVYSKYQKIENTAYINLTYGAFSHPFYWSTGQMEHDIIYSLARNSFFYDIGFARSKLIITKLFFCEQIDLPYEEFNITASKAYIIKTRKILGTNEYQESEMRDGEPFTIRVCLSDFLPDVNMSSQMVDIRELVFELLIVFISSRYF